MMPYNIIGLHRVFFLVWNQLAFCFIGSSSSCSQHFLKPQEHFFLDARLLVALKSGLAPDWTEMAKGLRSNNQKALRHARRCWFLVLALLTKKPATAAAHKIFRTGQWRRKGRRPAIPPFFITVCGHKLCPCLCRDLVKATDSHKAAEERRFAKIAATLAQAVESKAQVAPPRGPVVCMWRISEHSSSGYQFATVRLTRLSYTTSCITGALRAGSLCFYE